MKKLTIALVLSQIILLLFQLTVKAETIDTEQTLYNITYKVTPTRALQLDLYYPETPLKDKKYPVVIHTHGGGWNKGDKQIGDQGLKRMMLDAFLARGFVVASVNYRLHERDKVKMRDCVTDAKDAIRFLAKNENKFSIDANQFFCFGDSAGGQIAQMLTLTPADTFMGDPNIKDAKFTIRGGVSWYGPCDFEHMELFRKEGEIKAQDRFGPRIIDTDCSAEAKLKAYREMSSVNYLKATNPPLLLLQGDKDPTIPVHHAHHMKKRAESANAPIETLIIKNAAHGWKARGGEMELTQAEIVKITADFLEKSLIR